MTKSSFQSVRYQEIEAKTVAVRKRRSKETRVMPVEDFLKELNELIETKAVDAE